MNILIVAFFNKWVTHLGTELELAEKHLQAGDAVTFLVCDGSVGGCMNNPEGNTTLCNICRIKRIDGLSQLSGNVAVHSLKVPHSYHEPATGLPDSPTIEDYKALRYRGHDLGWAGLSTAISIHRDPLCDSEEAMQQAKKSLEGACRSYEGTRAFLERHTDFDRAYLFNGRFAVTRGAYRALEDADIPVHIHERGSSINHYQLWPNKFPHDQDFFQERLMQAWGDTDDLEKRDEMANLFYTEKRAGVAVKEKSYTKNQKSAGLPEGWDKTKRNIAIFSTSEDEMASIGDKFTDPVYASQAEGIRRIVEDTLADGAEIHYYLRMHPHLKGVENTSLCNILAIRSPNLTIIKSDDNISSYSLLDSCDCVFSFGSTVGIEATYWGKPSILAGKSFYDGLNVAHRARSHEEVMSLLLDANLETKNRLGALKYGYYVRTYGIRFEYWKPNDLNSGVFGDLEISDYSLVTGDRKPFHITAFFWLMNFCKSSRSLQTADRVAGYISVVHRVLRNMSMWTRLRKSN